MKKIIVFILTLTLLTTTLIGCGNQRLLDGMNGRDAAKLLLANERLDSQLLKNNGNIFENGVEVMNNLATTAINNMTVSYANENTYTISKLSTVKKLSTVLEGELGGKVEINGDTVVFSEFVEYNNSYDYFQSITESIVYSADVCARMIDHVKKNVRVVDKWISFDNYQYYLNVDENSELLCERDLIYDTVTICRRYKNADGDDVYEMYRGGELFEERMTYIPGKRYERSFINDDGEHAEDYFVADNGKGYWETYTVGVFPTHYNVSYFVMKHDICYDAFYDPAQKYISMLKVMSADRKTDILWFDGNRVDIQFSGFDGIESVVAPADSVDYISGEYANLSNGDNATVYLENGKTLRFGDRFLNDRLEVQAIHTTYIGSGVYIGDISLYVPGDTDAECLENLKIFLDEMGLQCRRNIDSVFNGIDRAYVELDSIIRYYTWNGVTVDTEEGIAQAIVKEKTRFSDMVALYDAIKNVEVLDGSDTDILELNIKFAEITQNSFNDVIVDAMSISIGSMSLTIEDTTLYVKDEPYKIMLALADVNGKLVHLDIENTASTKYADEKTFTVTASDLAFTLPTLSEGNYVLVAYIATSDNIRSSAHATVVVNEITNMPLVVDNRSVSASKDQNGALILTYAQAQDFTLTLTSEERLDYEAFKNTVSKMVFEYGTPSSILELVSGNTYTALTGNETEIANGIYRIAYEVKNGNDVLQGYVFVQYSCP